MGREARSHRPHPFFWFVFACVAVGAPAAATAQSASPAWALSSSWIYRAEVGVAAGFVPYLVAVVLWLAWHGQTIRKVGVAGVAGVETAGEPLETAADRLDELRRNVERAFADLEAAVREVSRQLARDPPAGR